MNKLSVMSGKEFYNSLIRYGCKIISIEGSHFKIEYPPTGRRAPIPIHGNKDIGRGFMKRILVQLGIDVESFADTL